MANRDRHFSESGAPDLWLPDAGRPSRRRRFTRRDQCPSRPASASRPCPDTARITPPDLSIPTPSRAWPIAAGTGSPTRRPCAGRITRTGPDRIAPPGDAGGMDHGRDLAERYDGPSTAAPKGKRGQGPGKAHPTMAPARGRSSPGRFAAGTGDPRAGRLDLDPSRGDARPDRASIIGRHSASTPAGRLDPSPRPRLDLAPGSRRRRQRASRSTPAGHVRRITAGMAGQGAEWRQNHD